MDTMTITSKFMNGIISKIIKRTIKKKIGYDIDIQLNEIEVSVIDGMTHVRLDVDGEISSKEFRRLVRDIGLD